MTTSLRRSRNLADEEIQCKSEDEIRKYMSNKSIVVLVSESYIDDTIEELNNRKVNSILTTLIEKRLDFRYHKNVLAKIEESVTEI